METNELLQAIRQIVKDEIQQEVEPIKQDLSEIKESVTKIELVQENITNKNIQLLFEAQQGINSKFQRLDRMEMTLNDVKSDTAIIKDVVTEHSKSIKELKIAK